MAGYVESIVGSGERVLHVGKVSLVAILPGLVGSTLLVVLGALAIAGGAILGAILVVLGALWFAAALIKRASTELAVTNKRVIAKFGFIRRSTVELNLSRIESVRVEQSVMGRIFGYGSIIVTGTGTTIDPIRYISDPIGFRQALQAATDQAG